MIEKSGFSYKFDEFRCFSCEGNCCIGESGYIWITIQEIELLAKFLKQSYDEVIKNSLRKIGYKYSINEVKIADNNFACKFFDLDKKQCSIYDVRPSQCKSFPFWDYFKENIEEVKKECPAIVE